MKKKYTKKLIQETINYWTSILENMEKEPTFENVIVFLKQNIKTIKSGITYILNFIKDDFKNSLKKINASYIIIPDNKWSEYKTDPTETNEDKGIIRIKQSYLNANPNFMKFDDEFGWAFHEFVHVFISKGKMPKTLLVNSPFLYPFNTTEIYAFGLQIKNIAKTSAYTNLLNYYKHEGCDEWVIIFNSFKDMLIN